MELRFNTRYEKGDEVHSDEFSGIIIDYQARAADGVWAMVENKCTGERRLVRECMLERDVQ